MSEQTLEELKAEMTQAVAEAREAWRFYLARHQKEEAAVAAFNAAYLAAYKARMESKAGDPR